jgi:hypothetical protein
MTGWPGANHFLRENDFRRKTCRPNEKNDFPFTAHAISPGIFTGFPSPGHPTTNLAYKSLVFRSPVFKEKNEENRDRDSLSWILTKAHTDDVYLQINHYNDLFCKFNLLPGVKRGAVNDVIYWPL